MGGDDRGLVGGGRGIMFVDSKELLIRFFLEVGWEGGVSIVLVEG